jgi:hypothetical protein
MPVVATARANGVGVTDGARVTLTTNMWFTWREVAVDHLDTARSVRTAAAASGNPASHLGDELRAGLVAVCAAAFSVEALQRELATLAVDAAMRNTWKVRKTSAKGRLDQTLKRSVTLRHSEVRGLVVRFGPVIESRGNAVHFDSEPSEPIPHPLGTSTSPEAVRYGLEKAQEAVDAMWAIFDALAKYPRLRVAEFVTANQHVLQRPPLDA